MSTEAVSKVPLKKRGWQQAVEDIYPLKINELKINDVKITYIYQDPKRPLRLSHLNLRGVLLRLDELRLTNCALGMVNEKASPPYRVYLADADFSLTNLSNQFLQGPAKARLQGKFMGSGATTVTALFRPEKNGPDFDLDVKIENTRLTGMNELLRAYGDFDVSAGYFSVYSELHVRNSAISGYVKPFFRDMKVYDRRRDTDKKLFQKMYEIVVGGVARLLERSPAEEIATKVDVSGTVKKPETSTWQVVIGLIRNAFFKAILPGFEKEVSRSDKREK